MSVLQVLAHNESKATRKKIMSDIFVKPLVDIYNSPRFLVTNNRASDGFRVLLTRIELEDLIAKSNNAMVELDEYMAKGGDDDGERDNS